MIKLATTQQVEFGTDDLLPGHTFATQQLAERINDIWVQHYWQYQWDDHTKQSRSCRNGFWVENTMTFDILFNDDMFGHSAFDNNIDENIQAALQHRSTTYPKEWYATVFDQAFIVNDNKEEHLKLVLKQQGNMKRVAYMEGFNGLITHMDWSPVV